MPSFGNNLRYLRKTKQMTQLELANTLGLSFSAISMYERGEREPSFEVMETIADYFNVTMDFLMGKTASVANTARETDVKEKPPVIDGGLMAANTVRIAGRDGSYVEKRLSDDQVDLLRRMIDQLPDCTD